MNIRPILFSGPMVRALLDGSKTQTRRVVKPQPKHTDTWTTLRDFGNGYAIECGPDYPDDHSDERHCPYGKPGDLLWVRETWRRAYAKTAHSDGLVYRADKSRSLGMDEYSDRHKWAPSIHMSRSLSRITLRITDVRVQRLQEIDEQDAQSEGVDYQRCPRCGYSYLDCVIQMDHRLCPEASPRPAVPAFRELWESINGPGSWDANPWVWELTFEVIQSNVDVVAREIAS